MLNANAHKNYTASGDRDAEELLKRVLSEMGETLSGTELCVVLGGSYGRGDGGVRQDRENGILYNDLDFFVFSRAPQKKDRILLDEIARRYEKELKVDVDFSRTMSVNDIKNNSGRLMMQELKRGYCLVSGEDLIEKYLQELPAEDLPFSEACRLFLNRGMGLLFAWEKISDNSSDTDFILRNINKAILGACDAFLITEKKYKWSIGERLTEISNSALSADCKTLYAQAVGFKKSPNRCVPSDLKTLWSTARNVFKECMDSACAEDIYLKCKAEREVSLKNFIKYCIKSRTFSLGNWKNYTVPAVAVLIKDVYQALDKQPDAEVEKSKLYQQWLIFN